MSKTQEHAQRTKGNMQPSKSAKAIEMIDQITSNYSGFTSVKESTGFTLLDEMYDSNLDTEFKMILKKISKKDSMTKSKGLEEFRCLVDAKDLAECIKDIDHKIREACQLTHEKLCLKVNKNLAPHLKTLMPYWMLAQCDTYANASSKAQNSFKNIFSDTKQPEVINFAKHEIINTISNYLIVETMNTLSDQKTTSEDEALQKYEIVVSMCFNGLILFLSYLNDPNVNDISEKLDKLLNDAKFWKFGKSKSTKIRCGFYNLIGSAITCLPSAIRHAFHNKAIPMVFYACDDDDYACSCQIWHTIMFCLLNNEQCWNIVNIRKAFLPKLYALLRSNKSTYSDDMFNCVLVIVKNIPDALNENNIVYNEILAALFDGIKNTRSKFNSNIPKQISCLFNSINHICIVKDNLTLWETLTEDYLMKLVDEYLNSNDNDSVMSRSIKLNLEKCLKAFLNVNSKHREVKQFLAKLRACMIQNQQVTKDVNNFIELFSALFTDTNGYNLEISNEFNIIVLNMYTTIVGSLNKSENDDDLICALTKLSMAFENERFLDVFNVEFEDGECLTTKLDKFNENMRTVLNRTNSCFLLDFVFVMNLCFGKIQQFKIQFEDYILDNFKPFVLHCFSNESKSELFKSQKYRHYSLELIRLFYSDDKIVTKFCHTYLEDRQDWMTSAVVVLVKNVLKSYQLFTDEQAADLKQNFKYIHEHVEKRLLQKISSRTLKLNNFNDLIDFSTFFIQTIEQSMSTYILWHFTLNFLRLEYDLCNRDQESPVNIENCQKLTKLCLTKLAPRLTDNKDDFAGLRSYTTDYLQACHECTIRDVNTIVNTLISLVEKLEALLPNQSACHIENILQILFDQVNNKDVFSGFVGHSSDFYANIYLKNMNRIVLVNNFEAKSLANWDLNDTLTKLYFLIKFLNQLLCVDVHVDSCGKLLCPDFAEFFMLIMNFIFASYVNKTARWHERIDLQFRLFLSSSNGLVVFRKCLEKFDPRGHFDFRSDEIGIFCMHIRRMLSDLHANENNLDFFDGFESSVCELANEKLEDFRLEACLVDWQCGKDPSSSINEALKFFNSLSTVDLAKLSSETNSLRRFLIQAQINFNSLFNSIGHNDDKPMADGALVQILDILIGANLKSTSFDPIGTDWLVVGFQQTFNEFLKRICTVKQLSAAQFDYILLYLTSESNKMKTKTDMVDFQTFLNGNLSAISFFDLFNTISDRITGSQNDKLIDEWNEFFSKEAYDALLPLYLRLCDYLASVDDGLHDTGLKLVAVFALAISKISVECLMTTGTPLTIQLDINDFAIMNKLGIDDRLQTVLNKFFPLLNHKFASLQTNAYLVLKKVIHELQRFYDNDCLNDVDTDIFHMLPKIMQTTMYAQLKFIEAFNAEFDFEETLVDHFHHHPNSGTGNNNNDDDMDLNADEAHVKFKDGSTPAMYMINARNNHLMAYVYTNKLLLELLNHASIEFKFRFLNDLRVLNLHDHLLNCLFRLMPLSPGGLFESTINDESDLATMHTSPHYSVFYLQNYACFLFRFALKCTPVLVRDWVNNQTKRIFDFVDRYTQKHVSPSLVAHEINLINTNSEFSNCLTNEVNEYESSIRIKGVVSTREITTVYKIKDLTMELVIRLPHNYPLGAIDVNCVKRIGVNENEWRNWMLQLTKYLMHQNGEIVEGIRIWKRNVDKKFNGVEECTICYSVIHSTNYQLPKMKCRTCKKKFHSYCLYKWFETSTKSTCPLCRNLF